jgi:hypothetical protein
VLGDGSSRLVIGKFNGVSIQLSIQKWADGHFAQTWIGGSSANNNSLVRVLPQTKTPARIFLTGVGTDAFGGNSWLWDGTNYVRQNLDGCVYDTAASLPETLVGSPNFGSAGLMKIATHDNNNDNLSLTLYKGYNFGSYKFGGGSDVVAADFDGDGNTEMAVSTSYNNPAGEPVEIYSLAGVRKAVTTKGYAERLAVWNPSASKHPFLVACRNGVDADGKPNGGFAYFIQWNGESYDEVWKSNQIGDAVIDMQVCDPKGEGKTGLVILSEEKDNYYLTKIVLAK